MKKILLIATGGTIASCRSENGLAPGIKADELYRNIPSIDKLCTVDSIQLLNIDSTNIQPEYWLMIAETIEKNYSKYDGFVITHGTDTLAYTAAALNYLIQKPCRPIVITGSQKPAGDSFSDAETNLRDSFCLACEDKVSGIYVVFGGMIILGARARKMRSKSFNAFESVNCPPAGLVSDGRIIRYTELDACSGSDETVFYHDIVPKVFVLKLIPGIEPDILDYIAEKYDAIVIESYGVGGLPFIESRNFLEKMKELKNRGKIIVIATQVMLEGSDMKLYEVGFRALRDYELLQAYDMTIESVVTKLMWMLGQNVSCDDARRIFYTPVARDILLAESV